MSAPETATSSNNATQDAGSKPEKAQEAPARQIQQKAEMPQSYKSICYFMKK